DVIARFTFPVIKSDQELAREAEELASTVKPIYEFQQRAFDSATIALHAFFAATQNAADQGGPQAVMRVAQEQRIVLSPGEAAYLAKGGKRRGLERALTDLFDRTLGLGVTPPGVLQVEQAPDLIIRRRSSETSVARGGGGVRVAAARLARPGHLLGAVGVLPPRDLPRVASGDAAREPVRARAAPGRRGGALLAPAP